MGAELRVVREERGSKLHQLNGGVASRIALDEELVHHHATVAVACTLVSQATDSHNAKIQGDKINLVMVKCSSGIEHVQLVEGPAGPF